MAVSEKVDIRDFETEISILEQHGTQNRIYSYYNERVHKTSPNCTHDACILFERPDERCELPRPLLTQCCTSSQLAYNKLTLPCRSHEEDECNSADREVSWR